MKKTKIIFAVLISIVMLSTLMFGCQRDSDSSQTTQTATTTTTRATTTGTTQAGETTEPEAFEMVEIEVLHRERGYPITDELRDMTRDYIAEKTGAVLNFEFVPDGEYYTVANLMLASGDQKDVWVHRFPQVIDVYNDGLILGITQEEMETKLANAYYNLEPQHLWWYSSYEDIYLGFPHRSAHEVHSFFQVREDWLNNLGLDLNKVQGEHGYYYKLTLEELEELMHTFKYGDPNLTGQDDTHPFLNGHGFFQTTFETVGREMSRYVEGITAMLTMEHGYNWWMADDGRLLPPELHPDYKKNLALIIDWIEKEYIHPDQESDVGTRELFGRGNVGLQAGWSSRFIIPVQTMRNTDFPDAWMVPMMVTGDGLQAFPTYANFDNDMIVISSKVDDMKKDAIFRWMDWSATTEGNLVHHFGIEGVSWRWSEDGKNIESLDKDGNPTLDSATQQYMLHFDIWHKWINSPGWPGLWPLTEFGHTERTRLHLTIDYDFPHFVPLEKYVVQRVPSWESRDYLGDLNTFIDEAKYDIIYGRRSIDEWDDIMDQWLSIGGEILINDKTAQYQDYLQNPYSEDPNVQ